MMDWIDEIERDYNNASVLIDFEIVAEKYIPNLISEVRRLREELSAFRKSEKELSDAYLRIRELVGAWDTKPEGEDRFEVAAGG